MNLAGTERCSDRTRTPKVLIRALNHMLFSMTDKTYEFWRPRTPLKMEELREVEFDVEKLPILFEWQLVAKHLFFYIIAIVDCFMQRFCNEHSTDKCEPWTLLNLKTTVTNSLILATCVCSMVTPNNNGGGLSIDGFSSYNFPISGNFRPRLVLALVTLNTISFYPTYRPNCTLIWS